MYDLQKALSHNRYLSTNFFLLCCTIITLSSSKVKLHAAVVYCVDIVDIVDIVGLK